MRKVNSPLIGDKGEKSSFDNELPSISAFPKGETAWRLDWLGDVAYPDRSNRRTQPSVFVHLSPVVDPNALVHSDLLLSSSSTNAYQQTGRWVSVGTLPFLQVGSVWKNGTRVALPDYHVETFPALNIGPSTATLVKAGVAKDSANFLLPLTEHPWHRRCTHSYCIELRLADDRRILIPCWELIRFYFGSSSGLVTPLFLPPLERESLYTKAEFDRVKGKLELTLAPRISGVSAADIGRLHLSAQAWRAALQIGTSLLHAANSEHGRYPQTTFPFEGITTLVASGKWLSHGAQQDSTFVVFSLRSCSHPFPFRALSYHSADRTQRPPAGLIGSNLSPNNSPPHCKIAPDARNQPLVERDASNRLTPLTKRLRINQRFPDLERKPIWKIKLTHSVVEAVRMIASMAQSVVHGAVGEPSAERRVRPVSLEAATTNRNPPTFLQPTLNRIQRLRGATVTVPTASDHDGWTVPVELQYDNEGEIDHRLFIPSEHGSTRLRRICVLLVTRTIRHHLIYVIEDEPPLEIQKILIRQKSFSTHTTVKHITQAFLEQHAAPKGRQTGMLRRLLDGLRRSVWTKT